MPVPQSAAMHPIRLTVLLSLALATIGGLSTCGGGGVSPSPPPPRQTAMVYEVRAPDASDGWVWRADITGRHPVRLTRPVKAAEGVAPEMIPPTQGTVYPNLPISAEHRPRRATLAGFWPTPLGEACVASPRRVPGNLDIQSPPPCSVEPNSNW